MSKHSSLITILKGKVLNGFWENYADDYSLVIPAVNILLTNSEEIREYFEMQELSYQESEYSIRGNEIEMAYRILTFHGVNCCFVEDTVLVKIP